MCDTTGHKIGTLIFFVIAEVKWILFRMIALPVLLLEIHKLRYEADRAYLQPYVTMSEIFLVAILVLNAYWMLLFLVMDYNVLCKGKVQDI